MHSRDFKLCQHWSCIHP